MTHSSALIVQSLPPQENATSGGESHGYVYSPCDSSYTPEPSTWSQNDWAASVGAVMMVLPESSLSTKRPSSGGRRVKKNRLWFKLRIAEKASLRRPSYVSDWNSSDSSWM